MGSSDHIRDVPVRELLHKLRDSCDSYDLSNWRGWLEMLEEEIRDAWFPALVRSLQEHGQRDPICVTEWYSAGGAPCWEMGNGHHRLTAAILLGWDTIMVDFSDSYSHRSDAHVDQFDNQERQRSTYEDAQELASLWARSAA